MSRFSVVTSFSLHKAHKASEDLGKHLLSFSFFLLLWSSTATIFIYFHYMDKSGQDILQKFTFNIP